MRKLILFSACILFSPVISCAQWELQNSGTNANLNSVHFTNANTGYCVGNSGTILKTLDGGINWTTQSAMTVQNLHSVYFTGPDTGYIAGDSSVLLKTVNGGIDWTFQNTMIPVNLNAIQFLTPDTGYAVGNYDSLGGFSNNGYILKTTNGGTLWSLIATCLHSGGTNPMSLYLNSVFFTTADAGYIVGIRASIDGPHGLIMKTTNGGFDWTSLDAWYYSRSMTSVYFTSADTGYVTGNFMDPNFHFPLNIKTTDAGNSWTAQNVDNISMTGNSVYFPDPNTGYIVGGTHIAKTLNSGTDWSFQSSGTSNALISVYFIDADTGYIVGAAGTILKTTNGGGFAVGKDEITNSGFEVSIYPNPVSQSTTFSYTQKDAGHVSIQIFNSVGQLVAEPLNTSQPKGDQKSGWNTGNLPAGLYFYRIQAGNEVGGGKLIKW